VDPNNRPITGTRASLAEANASTRRTVVVTVTETPKVNGTGPAYVTITKTSDGITAPTHSEVTITLKETLTVNGTMTVETITSNVAVTIVPGSPTGQLQAGSGASPVTAPVHVWVATGAAALLGLLIPFMTLV